MHDIGNSRSARSGAGRLRIGHGFDAHRLVEGRPCILGGVHIPSLRGPYGHSDADVLAHAAADAILGAACLGSLGEMFPDTDPRYKDANSLQLLGLCMTRATVSGYEVINFDATIVVQEPKLQPHIPAMRKSLADALNAPVGMVSIKAKTSEGMGYTGDGTGIAAYAVVLLGVLD